MEQEFVPYELAVKLKALGFDEECFSYYDLNNKPNFFGADGLMDTHCVQVNRPTFSQALRWLLKEYNLYAIIIPTVTMHWTFKTMTVVEDIVEVPPYDHVDANDYGTREEAELACLVKLIEIVETRTK